MNILWKPNDIASWVHLAWTRKDCYPSLGEFHTHRIHSARLWPVVKREASHSNARSDSDDEWLQLALRIHGDAELTNTGFSPSAITPADTAAWLVKLHDIGRSSHPRLTDDLSARVRPLREQWEARSPGFLRHLRLAFGTSDTSDADFELSLVAPALGGFAEAHTSSTAASTGTMEAMLYHPNPSVPEPVRVGWLVAQAMARPAAPQLTPTQLAWLVLPAVYEAAAVVEWCHADFDIEWMAHWGMPHTNSRRAAALCQWWQSSAGQSLESRLASYSDPEDADPEGADPDDADSVGEQEKQ